MSESTPVSTSSWTIKRPAAQAPSQDLPPPQETVRETAMIQDEVEEVPATVEVEEPQRDWNYLVSGVEDNPELVTDFSSTDVHHTLVTPPSLCHFYPFSNFSIGRVRGYHQSKFSAAASEQRSRKMVEAIQTLLPKDVILQDFTLPDYFWLLYYIRTTQYTKSQMVHKALCLNSTHLAQVNSGEKSEESLINLNTISKTNLVETDLNPEIFAGLTEDLKSIWEEGQELGYEILVRPSTVKDMLEAEELSIEMTEEIEFLLDAASCLQVTSLETGKRLNLEERMQLAEDLSPDALSIIGVFRELSVSYGVEEQYSFRCKDCGAVSQSILTITPHSFL